MNYKHGTRQRKAWRKLHLAIDGSGEIIAASLTTHSISDVSQVPDLLAEIEAPIDTFYGDSGGYDHPGTYDALDTHETQF
ncbi:MAG: transposase [Pseudomonadota bacterium]